MNPVAKFAEPQTPFRNPHFNLRTLLQDLEISQNLHLLSGHPLPPLTKTEKEALLKGYKNPFAIKPDKKGYRTTLYKLYEELLSEVELEAVYHCGSGGLKTIASTYFSRAIQVAYFLIHKRKLVLSKAQLEVISEACKNYCHRTDDDLQNVFADPVKKNALDAHNFYLNYFAKLCHTNPFIIQNKAFKKIHVPKDKDPYKFWLHSFARYDIVGKVDEGRKQFKRGLGKIMVLPLFQDDLDCELRVEAPLENPWELIFDILCGRLSHAEEASRYEWRDTLKMWAEMVKGSVPTDPELIPRLVDLAMNLPEEIDLFKQIENYWRDHLPTTVSSGCAYVMQILSHLVEHPKADDALLEKIIKKTKPTWKSSPYSEFLSVPTREALQDSFAFLSVLGWLQGFESSETWVQLHIDKKAYSYLTLSLRFDEALTRLARNPEFVSRHSHWLPPLFPYSRHENAIPEESRCENLLRHDAKVIRQLGLRVYLKRLTPPERLSPFFYELLPSFNLTSSEWKLVTTYHPEAELPTDFSELSLARGLIKTRDHRYYPVATQFLNRIETISSQESYSLFQLAKGSEIENTVLSRSARDVGEWQLDASTNEQDFLLFASKVIGTLVRQDEKEQAAGLFSRLIVPSTLKTAIKLKILRQLLQAEVTLASKVVIEIQPFLYKDSECTYYLNAIAEFYGRDDQVIIFKRLMTEFKNSPKTTIADSLVHVCQQLPEESRYDFWHHASTTQTWTVLEQSQGEYNLLTAELFKNYYQRGLVEPLKPLADELKSTIYDDEIATLQSEYIESHLNELDLANIPRWHTSCLTNKHKLRIKLLRIKKMIERGDLKLALRQTLSLKKIPTPLITSLETSICEHPETHGSIMLSKQMKKLYAKVGKSRGPVCAEVLNRLSYVEAPEFAQQLLTDMVMNLQENIVEDLFPKILGILSASDRDNYSKEFLERFQAFIPKLFPFCDLTAFAMLNRFRMLDLAAETGLETILTLCQKNVQASPLLVEGIMETLATHNCGPLGSDITFELARHHQSKNLEKSLFWFGISEAFNSLDLSTRTAYLYQIILNVSSLSSDRQPPFYLKLLPLVKETPDLLEALISSFIDSSSQDQINALPLYDALYQVTPAASRLDTPFWTLIKSCVREHLSLSREEQKMMVNILTYMALEVRSIFSILHGTPSKEDSLDEIETKVGDFLRLSNDDITYLAPCFESGTDEQKVVLIDLIVHLPPFFLTQTTYKVLLRCVIGLNSYPDNFLSKIMDRTQIYRKFLKGNKHRSEMHILLPYLQLSLKEGSDDAFHTACQLVKRCLTLLPRAEGMTPPPFTRKDILPIHHDLLTSVSNRPQADSKTKLLTTPMNPEVFPTKTLLLAIELLQKFHPKTSFEGQLKCWKTIVSRVKISEPTELPEGIRPLFSQSIKGVFKYSLDPRPYVTPLVSYRWVVHYFDDAKLIYNFVKHLILSSDCRVVKHIPALLSAHYKKSMPQARKDLTMATQLVSTVMHTKNKPKSYKIAQKYIDEVIQRKITAQIMILHEVMLLHVPTLLLQRASKIDQYEKFLMAFFQPKSPYLPFATIHMEEILNSLLDVPGIVKYTQNPTFHRILLLFSDQMHEKLTGQGLELDSDYTDLIHLLVMIICSWDHDLLRGFDIERFIDLFAKEGGSPQSQKVADILRFLDCVFQKYSFNYKPGGHGHECGALYAFSSHRSPTGFALAILLHAVLRRLSPEKSLEDDKKSCKTLQIALASEHGDSGKSSKEYCNEIKKFYIMFQREMPYSEFLDGYFALIKDQEEKSPLMESIYGGLLAIIRPEMMEFSEFLKHLHQFATFETVEGNEDDYPKIIEILSFYLREQTILLPDMIDRLVAIMGHFVNSAETSANPQLRLIPRIVDLLYTRDNLSDFEADIAPFTAQAYSWDKAAAKAPTLDIAEAKKHLMTMCTTLQYDGMKILMATLLAEYKAHVDAKSYHSLVKTVSQQMAKESPSAISEKSCSWDLIEYYTTLFNERDSFAAIDSLCDLIAQPDDNAWALPLLFSFWHHYQWTLPTGDFTKFFENFEKVMQVCIKDKHFIKSTIKHNGKEFTFICKLLDYLIDRDWLKRQNLDYFESLFASLKRIAVIVSKSAHRTETVGILTSLKLSLSKAIPRKFRSENYKALIQILTKGWTPEEFNEAFGTDIQFLHVGDLDSVIESVKQQL